MESSSGGRCGQIASDISIILVTAAQLVFFVYFYEYIAWPVTQPDGSITRLSLLTDDYFTWLPIVVAASIIVIVANIVLIVYDRYWYRQTAWILFCIIGLTVVVSLLAIFPFDFSVIPDGTAADIVPIAVTVFFVLMAIFYGTTALVMLVQLIRHYRAKEETV